MSIICPGLVLGPSFSDLQNTNDQCIVDGLFGPAIIDFKVSCVDVRDVAKGHILALEDLKYG